MMFHHLFDLFRLESLNIGWTGMTRGAVVYLLICLPSSLQRLNLSGCRETLQDEGNKYVKRYLTVQHCLIMWK